MRSPTPFIVRQSAVLTAFLIASAVASPSWAADDKLANVPIERFHQVDEGLYRGAQPTEAGFRHLRELGVRTVVNLRMEADAKRTNEKQIVESLGMRYIQLSVEDGNFFTRSRTIPDEVIREFFTVLNGREPGPIFVHCHRGADRTGAVVAFYRIARQGWDSDRALKEARALGMRSWYRGLQNQIAKFSTVALQLILAKKN
jgi:protein tyrosine/serine phosphatase